MARSSTTINLIKNIYIYKKAEVGQLLLITYSLESINSSVIPEASSVYQPCTIETQLTDRPELPAMFSPTLNRGTAANSQEKTNKMSLK